MTDYPPTVISWTQGVPPTEAAAQASVVAVFNTTTLAATEYSCAWSAVAAINGSVYGLGPNGIELLSGTPSTQSQLVTGTMRPVPGFNCSITRAYAQGTALATMLTTVGMVNGVPQTAHYKVPAWLDGMPRTLPLGRSTRAASWQFTITGHVRLTSFEIALGQVLRAR